MVWLLLGANGVLGDSGPIDLSCEISSASSNSRSTTSESWLDFIQPPTFAKNKIFVFFLNFQNEQKSCLTIKGEQNLWYLKQSQNKKIQKR